MEINGYTTDDHETYTKVITTPNGVFRSVIERDHYAESPDFDMGVPVIDVDLALGGHGSKAVVSGWASWRGDGLSSSLDIHDAIYRAWASARSSDQMVEILDRWLRVYHGGSARTMLSPGGAAVYLHYTTETMRRDVWGIPEGDAANMIEPVNDEWNAYLDGEVFVVNAERAVEWNDYGEVTVWEDSNTGWVCGYYGLPWAIAAADERLGEIESEVSRNMLPLEA